MYNRFKAVGYAIKKGGFNPRHTVVEIAEEFGITTASLAQILNLDSTAPKPIIFDKPGCIVSKHTRYDIVEIRRWWKARQIRKQHEKD